MKLSIKALGTQYCYAECRLNILSVANKLIMLDVIMLSVIILSVNMLSVVAPALRRFSATRCRPDSGKCFATFI
jgi:hypothetical protein